MKSTFNRVHSALLWRRVDGPTESTSNCRPPKWRIVDDFLYFNFFRIFISLYLCFHLPFAPNCKRSKSRKHAHPTTCWGTRCNLQWSAPHRSTKPCAITMAAQPHKIGRGAPPASGLAGTTSSGHAGPAMGHSSHCQSPLAASLCADAHSPCIASHMHIT